MVPIPVISRRRFETSHDRGADRVDRRCRPRFGRGSPTHRRFVPEVPGEHEFVDGLVIAVYDASGLNVKSGFNVQLVAKIAHLPLVERSTNAGILDGNINLNAIKGVHPHIIAGETPPTFIGSDDGEFSQMDRVSLVKGRLANPDRVGEAVMNAQAADEMGVHIGSVIQVPIYTDAQTRLPNIGKPFRILKIKLVGEIVESNGVVDSDFDALGSPAVIFSPALTRSLETTCATRPSRRFS